jgi:hypothetical protein
MPGTLCWKTEQNVLIVYVDTQDPPTPASPVSCISVAFPCVSEILCIVAVGQVTVCASEILGALAIWCPQFFDPCTRQLNGDICGPCDVCKQTVRSWTLSFVTVYLNMGVSRKASSEKYDFFVGFYIMSSSIKISCHIFHLVLLVFNV